MRRLLLCVTILLLSTPAQALRIEPALPDAAQEAVAQASFHALKCVVCEGQSLADSDATFAAQMRAEIRRMAASGASETDILAYFQTHYGTRILLNPPLTRQTIVLFAAPLAALILGALLLYRLTRRPPE